MSEVEQEEQKHQNFHLNDYIVRQNLQQQQHQPSTSATMLYNNYYHHHQHHHQHHHHLPETTPLPPLPSFFHPQSHQHVPASTKAFPRIVSQQEEKQLQSGKPQIRVRNFPKEDKSLEGERERQKDFSHFALHYHERDRLIREHQHEQIKRSKTEQQERASNLVLSSSPRSQFLVNGGETVSCQDKVIGGHGDTNTNNLNSMYTKRNSSGQNNGFLLSVAGEMVFFFVFFILFEILRIICK